MADTEGTLMISLLGPLEVRAGDKVVPLAGTKQRALLCSLALNPGVSVSVGTLIAALWDAAAPRTARAKVHTYVCELRKALRAADPGCVPGWPILTWGSGYQIGDDVGLDSSEFEAKASRARRSSRLGDHAGASELFTHALAMWRGSALADVESCSIQAAARALNEERLLAIEGKAEADLHLGWNDEVVAELSPVLAGVPLRERLRGQLMLALYRRGARNEALAEYRDCHQAMMGKLGLPPGPQLRRLQQLIFRDDPALWSWSPHDLLSLANPGGAPSPA